jgi:hypothetical protein
MLLFNSCIIAIKYQGNMQTDIILLLNTQYTEIYQKRKKDMDR